MMHVLGDQTAQVLFMDRQGFNIQHFHQLRVHAFAEITAFVQDIGETTGHTCPEVNAGFAQHADNTAGHVFTAVIADTFHHGDGTGVTHRKTLTCTTCGKQTTTGSTVQTGVADDAGIAAAEGRADRRTHRQQTARHAFTDVVVGIASQVQLNATGIPHAEALTCGTAEVSGNRIGSQTLVAVRLCDVTRERCAD